jgi:hypothetical protein
MDSISISVLDRTNRIYRIYLIFYSLVPDETKNILIILFVLSNFSL